MIIGRQARNIFGDFCLTRPQTKMWISLVALQILAYAITDVSGQMQRILTDSAPRIIEHPQNTIVQLGYPGTLNCRAEGRPEPEIIWIKDGESMDDLLDDQQQPYNNYDSRSLVSAVSIGDLQQLFFLRVNMPYVGSYQCWAQNRLGTVKSQNATLEVAFLRDVFRTEPVSSAIGIGDDIVLECDPPIGYPPPTVRWMKNEMMIEPDGRRELLSDGNLMISEVRTVDAGAYTCTASNMIGSKVSRSAVICPVRSPPMETVTTEKINCDIKPRRYDITDQGVVPYFRGWVDVQGQGSSNDYCRVVVGRTGHYLSCALGGTTAESEYNFNSSGAGDVTIDVGYLNTWFMKDEDGDGKDDYCRCVGERPNTTFSCMKAGDTGFIGMHDFTPVTSGNCHLLEINPFLGPP